MNYDLHHILPDGSPATPHNSLHYPPRTKEAEERYAKKLAFRKANGKGGAA